MMNSCYGIYQYRARHSLPSEPLERGFPPKMYLDTGLAAKIHIVYQVIILKCIEQLPSTLVLRLAATQRRGSQLRSSISNCGNSAL